MSRIKDIAVKVLAAESKSPAVHGALRALQAAVVAVAVGVIRSYVGV
jgi:hypothetical protein